MRIGHEGLRPHIEAFREWDQAEEIVGFKAHFDPKLVQIIEVDGQDAGYIKLEPNTEFLYLDGIYISKTFRSKGLGEMILREAVLARSELPVRLRVFKTNPARRLYERLGFKIIRSMEDAFLMEYQNQGFAPNKQY